MRVLALTNLYPNPYEPHRATFNLQHFRALALEHDVRVIAPIAWTNEWKLGRGSGGLLPSNRERVSDGITVHHPRYAFTPKVLRAWYGRFFLRCVRGSFERALKEFCPDVLLGCWAYPDGWAAVRLARESGLPVAIMVHGSDVLLVRDSARMRPTVDALQRADAVITVSADLARVVRSMGVDGARTHVVYHGVNRELFCPGSRLAARDSQGLVHDEPVVLFVGNLVPVKGLDVLIDACSSLARAGLAFKCLLVGQGPLKNHLQKRIAQHDLQRHVHLLGAKPLEQMPAWYRAADLVVLPSRSEGVPNVLLEAAACGTPFVASRVGGIPEIAHPESLVPPGDAAVLADKIRSMLRLGRAAPPSPFQAPDWSESARALARVLQGTIPIAAEVGVRAA